MNDEQLLGRVGAELDRRAEALPPAHLTLADVRERAGEVRRRRRTTAAVCLAAAAVVLAAVLVPVVLLGGQDRAIDPADSPTRAPSSVLHERVVTRPDGTTVPVPFADEQVSAFGVLADGRVVVMRTRAVTVLEADGSVASEHPVAGNVLTMGADDATAAWVSPEGAVQVLESGVARPVALPATNAAASAEVFVHAVLGSGCAAGGCEALVGEPGATSLRLSAGEMVPLVTSERMEVTDVSPDGRLWAVELAPAGPDEQFGCAALYDPAAGAVVARTCRTSALEFSPDGAHVLGQRGDNNMVGEALVLDLRLRAVLTVAPARGEALRRVGWADADGVLEVRTPYDGQGWTLARRPLDGGGPELLDGPVAGPDPEPGTAYLLSGGD